MVKSEPVTPLGRPKATKSLGGLVEPESLPRLLIWHICHESFGDLADLNHCHSYWGPWSCPTMVIPSEQLSIAYFCKWFLSLLLLPCCFHGLFVSLLLLDFSYVNKHIFSGSTINYKLTEHGQVLIWRPSARFDFLLPSYYGVNRCLSTRLDFQLQVVNTGSSYNPETINPVWFDYESPVLYMVKPVFITTRYGLSSTGTIWKELPLLKIGVITLTTKNW